MKVFIIAALTADGFIGRDSGHLADWTSGADKKAFVRLTKQAGTMVMGRRTFDTIGRALPERHTIVYTASPQSLNHPDIEATNEHPKALVSRLASAGTPALAICGGASIYGAFMSAGVVDELYLTIEPILFGSGVRLFDQDLSQQLELLDTEKLGQNSILLHYAVKK